MVTTEEDEKEKESDEQRLDALKPIEKKSPASRQRRREGRKAGANKPLHHVTIPREIDRSHH